jgi:hypothetical protein
MQDGVGTIARQSLFCPDGFSLGVLQFQQIGIVGDLTAKLAVGIPKCLESEYEDEDCSDGGRWCWPCDQQLSQASW